MPSPDRSPDDSGPPRLGDRFRMLHAHQRTITSDLSLPVMAERITEAACDVVGAGVGVLVFLDAERTVERVVHRGLTGDTVTAEHTRLAERVDAARTPSALTAALAEAGLRHLGSEIEVSGAAYAHLVVAEPLDGTFGEDDRAIFAALSRSAGSALEHATLFHHARSGVQWLHASGEIARAMLADADIDAFTEIVARAVEAANADYGQLIVPTADGQLRILAAHGLADDEYIGMLHDPDASDLTRAVVNGKTLRAPAIIDLLSSSFVDTHGFGPVMLAPLLDALGTRGSVLLTRYEQRPAFVDSDVTQFANYAAQVALAMQFADARLDTERLQRVEARADASRELSDIVMQRLFAVGIGLDTLSVHLAGTVHHEKLERHITDLDRTIDEIRQRVFVSEDAAPKTEPVRFPRILLPESPDRDRGLRPRGRRRSDWRDGTGTAGD